MTDNNLEGRVAKLEGERDQGNGHVGKQRFLSLEKTVMDHINDYQKERDQLFKSIHHLENQLDSLITVLKFVGWVMVSLVPSILTLAAVMGWGTWGP